MKQETQKKQKTKLKKKQKNEECFESSRAESQKFLLQIKLNQIIAIELLCSFAI